MFQWMTAKDRKKLLKKIDARIDYLKRELDKTKDGQSETSHNLDQDLLDVQDERWQIKKDCPHQNRALSLPELSNDLYYCTDCGFSWFTK